MPGSKHGGARRLGVLGVLAGAGLLGSCGARTPLNLFGTVCTPGETRTCTMEDCPGEQTCLADGAWSDCQCDVAPPVDEPCFEQSFRSRARSVSLHVLVDRSGSMLVFWPDLSDALRTFFGDPESAGFSVALDFFASRDGDECSTDAYRVPDVRYGELLPEGRPRDAHEADLVRAVETTRPAGSTPMFPAYAGAVEAARARARTSGDQSVIVLVTDGTPQGCGSENSSSRVIVRAEEAAAGSPAVRSFAIGLVGAEEALVRRVAEVGRGEAFFVDDTGVAVGLVDSLNRIRERLTCDYELLDVGAEVAAEDVTVSFTPSGGARRELAFDPDCRGAGWSLVTAGTVPRVSLCPEACAMARDDDGGEIAIAAACARVDPIGTGGSGGTSGTGGSGGSGGGAVEETLGAACETDGDCGAGLFCMTTGSGAANGGGPARGLCTAQCGTHDDCEAIDADSRCEAFGGGDAKHCVERCMVGPRGLTRFDPNKCHGRSNVACSPLGASAGITVCLPQCNGDFDCGDGYSCDPGDGLCRRAPATGLPMGSRCMRDEDCRGACFGSDEFLAGRCTEYCVDGAQSTCGWPGPTSGPAPAACMLPLIAVASRGGPGQGDLSACVALCDDDADCAGGAPCVPFQSPPLIQSTGRQGACGIGFGAGGVPIPQ